jgi:heme-degrading monooxygenase HmoA
MYARQLVFKASAERRSDIEKLADQAFGFMKSLKGFISVHFLVSEDETQYSSFSLWETKEDAEASGAAITEKTAGTLHELALESPELRVYEIYKPKT